MPPAPEFYHRPHHIEFTDLFNNKICSCLAEVTPEHHIWIDKMKYITSASKDLSTRISYFNGVHTFQSVSLIPFDETRHDSI